MADLDELTAMLFHDSKLPLAQMMIAMPCDGQELLTAMSSNAPGVSRLRASSCDRFQTRGLKRAYRIAAPTSCCVSSVELVG